MKKLIATILTVTLLLCAVSCAESQSAEAEILAPDEPRAGTLRISTMAVDDYDAMYKLIQAFEEANSDVTVEIDYCFDEFNRPQISMSDLDAGSTIDWQNEIKTMQDNFLMRTIAKISSDEPPDVIISLNGMNFVKQTESGMLVDFNEYIKADPAFAKEEYFENILKASEINGKLTYFPVGYSFKMMTLNSAVTSRLDSFIDKDEYSYAELMDYYDEAVAQGIISPEDADLIYGDKGKARFFDIEEPDYINFEAQNANFKSQEFIDFLEKTDEIPTARKDIGEGSPMAEGRRFYDAVIDYQMFGGSAEFVEFNQIEDMRNAFLSLTESYPGLAYEDLVMEFPNVSPQKFLVSSMGKRQMEVWDNLVIPQTAQNKALAWEFVKFCVAEQSEVEDDAGNIYLNAVAWPINKANARKVLEKTINDSDDRGIEIPRPPLTEEDMAKAEETWNAAMELFFTEDAEYVNSALYGFADVSDELNNFYYKKLITAEECAAQIQSKTEILMKE